MALTIDQSLRDPNLLGSALGDPSTWATWQTVLKSAFAVPLSKAERKTFKAVAGDRQPPAAPVKELWCVAGRQSGKSRIAALISAYLAAFIDHRSKLAPGERGFILTLSPSLDQSQIIYRYALAFLESSPILRRKIVDANATEIKLEGNVVISTHPASYRTIRGRTLLAVVFDESAFWRSDESASPDREVYRAISRRSHGRAAR
jgi:phage terminase large subunit-like protein